MVLPKHKEHLKKMLGCCINYASMPNLSIGRGAMLPDDSMYQVNKTYQGFYLSSLVNLRLENSKGKRFWITIKPGPDAPIEPWAPLEVKLNDTCDYGEAKKDYSHFEKEKASKWGIKSKTQIENEFMDKYNYGFGLNRLSMWYNEEKIVKIELYDVAPYAACIITHSSGKSWSMYAEYDFEFWINFSEEMARDIRATCELIEVVE